MPDTCQELHNYFSVKNDFCVRPFVCVLDVCVGVHSLMCYYVCSYFVCVYSGSVYAFVHVCVRLFFFFFIPVIYFLDMCVCCFYRHNLFELIAWLHQNVKNAHNETMDEWKAEGH